MSAIYLLIPLAMLLLAIAVALFFWAVKRGQFDDLDSPGHSILLDDRQPSASKPSAPNPSVQKNGPGSSERAP